MISILLPVFNAAPFLQECLDSIINQTDSDWELLAVDDCSTDESLNILISYAQQDHRIKVLQNQKKGIIPALQLAYENSKGTFITRMDADDKMAKHKLLSLRQLLLQSGEGYVATGLVKYFSAQALRDGYKKYEAWLNQLTSTQSNFSEIYKECVIPSPCWMLWRTDLEKCEAFNPSTYPEDYDLCFRMYQMNLKVTVESSVLHYWRDHKQRSSRTDEHYSDNRFLVLKLHYFLKLDYQQSKPLVLWGAGKKGKMIAKMLREQQINFHWVCDTPTKWGHKIHGVPLQDYKNIINLGIPQIIVAVAAPSGQIAIKKFLRQLTSPPITYFFC